MRDKSKRKQFYKSKAWNNVRQRVLARDNYECQECKKNGIVTTNNPEKHKTLDVDHIKELEFYPDLALEMDNLITLCIKCHNKKHNRYQKRKRKQRWNDEWW
ncbi:HNH endonuclease [Staphylococcus pseudintermedius]|uniref:Putative HNH nuclease YajD n=1 Tax=Staphylococcus pseudintermedius TaxID=283734 RepID=A0A8H9BV17_STAPS|nr:MULTISPECIES: HNH endonuclease [Staphylococcus]EGQ0314122.1 HNH endonuclease [Staphylococcus pseudintermedius]EGQ0317845.1 HNH endonuclease [Staphylococcus pseudintermedius]EGQ0379305.1 HNH endonuclease [Staphylococcus pseudintermedius]EGQ0383547.1 HNH endonuclease [Staphylococcus pseudintermedius]EGQ0389626.1 HNH endonuclease [Staphylococcus pseudintermedius]